MQKDTDLAHNSEDTLLVPSGLVRRTLAYLLDCVIFLVSMAVYASTIMYTPLPALVSPWEYVIIVLPAYFVLSEGLFGRTIGKHLLGLTIITTDGSPMNMGKSLIRNFMRIIDGLPFIALISPYPVGLISIIVSPTNQRVGDRVANTLVVRTALQNHMTAVGEVLEEIETPHLSVQPLPYPKPSPALSISTFVSNWNDIIEQVLESDRRTAALMRDTWPSKLDGHMLTLMSLHDFHVASLSRESSITHVENAIREVVGTRVHCRIMLTSQDRIIVTDRLLDKTGEYDGYTAIDRSFEYSDDLPSLSVLADELENISGHYPAQHVHNYTHADTLPFQNTEDNDAEYAEEEDEFPDFDAWDYDIEEESLGFVGDTNLNGSYLAQSMTRLAPSEPESIYLTDYTNLNYFRSTNHIEPSLDDLDSSEWDYRYSDYDQ